MSTAPAEPNQVTAPTGPPNPRLGVAVPAVLASLSMLGPFSTDTAFPAFAAIQAEFSVGAGATQQLVSAYLLAFAAMSLFHGPLSDAVGRKPVIFGGLAVYVLASVGCAFAPSMGVLLAFRALQGLSAGGGVIVSRVVIRDLYSGADAQRLMSRVMMIFGLAPAVAPIIGGWLLIVGPWRVIFWFLAAFGLVLVAVVAVVLPETHPEEARIPLAVRSMLGDLAAVGRSARFHRIAWAAAFSFGGVFLYIGAAAIFVVDLLGRGATDFWVFFGPLIVGLICGSFVSGRAAGRLSTRRLVSGGLGVAVVAGVVNVALMLAPSTARLPYAVIAPAVVAFGVSCAYPSLQLAALDLFPHSRGAAASGTTVAGLVLNALGAGLVAPIVTRSLATLAVTSLGMVLVGSGCWTWHLVKAYPPGVSLTPRRPS